MPQNKIQFQPGMSLSELIERFGTEALCEAALERARWPSRFVCPQCGESVHCTFLTDGRKYWQCAHCRAQTTVRSGTLFHASKLPLTKWFQAICLVTQNKSNISALSLKRHLGVCYRTAWRIKHKLLEAMAESESRRLLKGVVMADDAYLGGVHAGKPGRGSENKVPFLAAVELNDEGHPQHVRFDPIADLTGASMANWAGPARSCSLGHRRLGELLRRRGGCGRARRHHRQPAPIERPGGVRMGQHLHCQSQDRDPWH
ncbi:MAG: IS1595 family transposase, partial [Pseudomonadota bacterium]|nr:IS1595 family transposase [Pseudomonadota bacterium]